MCLRQALVDMSEQATQVLARGSAALGRVAELESRVAELEAWSIGYFNDVDKSASVRIPL